MVLTSLYVIRWHDSLSVESHWKQGASRPPTSVDLSPHFQVPFIIRHWLKGTVVVSSSYRHWNFTASHLCSSDSHGRQADLEFDAPTDLKVRIIEFQSYSSEGGGLLPITSRNESILCFACLIQSAFVCHSL